VVKIQQLTNKVMLQPSYWTAFSSKTYKWADSWVLPPHQMGYLGLILLIMGSASYFSLSDVTKPQLCCMVDIVAV
jgi:hypothetical protein